MADIVLSPVLQVIFDRLASPILQVLGDRWDLKDNFQNLQQALLMAQAVLEEAEDQHVTNKAVQTWLLKLKAAAYDAEDLLDKLAAHLKKSEAQEAHFSSFFDAKKIVFDADEVRKKLQELQIVAIEGSNFNLQQGNMIAASQFDERETGCFVIESEIYGRNKDKEEIVKLLLSSEENNKGNLSFIPIIGMGGLGKTTLAQLAYYDNEVTQHFDVKLWVFVSDAFDVRRIIKEAIESATMEKCENLPVNVLQSKLWALLHKKRYLVVLDDVWNEDQKAWDKLKPVFVGGMDGSKIVITTRNQKVALVASFPTYPYYLKELDEDDCWKLFKHRAFPRGEESKYPNLVPIGKEIIKKCGGIPLAVKTMSVSMRFKKQEREWLFVQNSDLWKLDVYHKEILPVMKSSYLLLPSHLKRCFAFCSILPKGYEIKKEKLIQLWMAVGLIRSDGTRKPLEDIGEEYFQDLIWKSFFHDSGDFDNGDKSGYRMHHIIHDLAQSVAGHDSIVLEKGLPSCSLTQIRHAAVVCDSKNPEIHQALCKAKRLRTLILSPGGDTTEFPDQLFATSTFLRVLDMSASGLHYLVHSIGNCLCLRYLDLSYTPIRFLPYGTVEQLPFLQTLNLCGCINLKELPIIAKMMSLRHLDITGCESLTAMSPSFDALYKNYGRSFSRAAQHEKFFNSTFEPGFSSQLHILPTIVVGGFLDLMFLGRLNLQVELKIIHLENVNTSNDTENANLMEKDNLDSLGLYWGEKHDISILNPVQEDSKPPFLKREQHHSTGSSEQHQSDANAAEEVAKGLQPHQNLKMLVVKGYPGNRFPHWMLPNLTKVDLRDCPNCNYLPVLGNLLFLKTLILHGMPSLVHIGTEFYGEASGQLFPSLEELVLSDFLNLQEWLDPDGKDAFPKLSKLIVKKCPKLISMPLLASLEHLEIRKCSAVLFNSIKNASSLTVLAIEEVAEFSPSSEGIFVNNPLLSSLEIIACPGLCFLPSELGNLNALKSLKIHRCEELSSFQQGFQHLKALESLEICHCHCISIPEGIGSISSLRSLCIDNCDNLTSLPLSLKNLTCLEHLTIMNCRNLVSLPEDMHRLSALQSLTILSCSQVLSLPEELQHITTMH